MGECAETAHNSGSFGAMHRVEETCLSRALFHQGCYGYVDWHHDGGRNRDKAVQKIKGGRASIMNKSSGNLTFHLFIRTTRLE